jgi:HEAT repeat protein
MPTHAARIHRDRAPRPLKGLLLAFAFALAASAAPSGPPQQARDLLSRLAPSQSGSEAAQRTLNEGRALLTEQKWQQAAVTFSKFLADYPADRNIDAAMYWLAYASEKQGDNKRADMVLGNLLRSYPRSTWADDAKVLQVKVRTKLGLPVNQPQVSDEAQLQIIALQTLCQNNPPGCAARVAEVLSSNAAPVVKEAGITLLGKHGGAEAVPALLRLSRSEPNDKLRMKAIRALGHTGDERGLEVLREVAMSEAYADESPADSAIHALAEHDSQRAVQIIGEVAVSGKNPKARIHAIDLLSRRRGEQVVDQLFRIYDAVQDVQLRKHVLAGFGVRKDPRAVARLTEVARSSDQIELRKQAIFSLSRRSDFAQMLDQILPLYDAERDPELKSSILDALGAHQTPAVSQKLMQIVRDSREPLERRKRAMSFLSKSKDPEVMRFLESMLK